ncbi:hypothetical protein [Streptomyces sp. NPDC014006]
MGGIIASKLGIYLALALAGEGDLEGETVVADRAPQRPQHLLWIVVGR